MERRRRRGVGPMAAVAGVGLLVALAGCGGGGGSEPSVVAEQSGDTGPDDALDAVPADLDLGVVAATDDAGWVTGTRGGGALGLWRVDDNGATRVAEFPDIDGLDIEGSGDRLVAVATSCEPGDGDCEGWQADVLQFSADGSLDGETTVFEADRPMEDSDGVLLIGPTADRVWAETSEGLVGVAASGEVVERSGTPGGHVCAFESGLFRLGYIDGGDTEADRDDLATSSSSDASGETRTYQVEAFADGAWQIVEEATTFPVEQSLEIGCQDDAIVVEDRADGHLVGRWNEEAGWTEGPDTGGGSTEVEAADGGVASRSAGVVQVEDGSVFVRDGQGRMVETGLDLPSRPLPGLDEFDEFDERGELEVPDGSAEAPPGVAVPAAPVYVATSGDFVIGCVSDGGSGAGNGTVCDTDSR